MQMQTPIFLSSEQLHSLFNQGDSLYEDPKSSQHIQRPAGLNGSKYQKPQEQQLGRSPSWTIMDDVSRTQLEDEYENRKTDQNYQMIMIPQDEYYQMKADVTIYEDQLNELRKEVNKLEEVVIRKDESFKDLQRQLQISQRSQASQEMNVMKQKHQILQDQNTRLTNQLKELLNKNKELVEEGQANHDLLLKTKIDLQSTEIKLSTQTKETKKLVQKYEKEIARLQGELNTIRQVAESQNYSSKNILIEEKVELDKIPSQRNGQSPVRDRGTPQTQWKSNIVYGTSSQHNSAIMYQRVSMGNPTQSSFLTKVQREQPNGTSFHASKTNSGFNISSHSSSQQQK